MNKILIIGSSGSGKSTLSKQLQEILGIPLIHLDKEYWKPGWLKPANDEWSQRLQELCNMDQWIMDGNFISSLEYRLQYADMIIWLDINRIKCLYRAIMRVIKTSKKHRSDMAYGCIERHDIEFYQYIWNFPKSTRPRIQQLLSDCAKKKVIVLRNNRDIKSFLNRLDI